MSEWRAETPQETVDRLTALRERKGHLDRDEARALIDAVMRAPPPPSDLSRAVAALKRELADTGAWRALVRFVEHHPLIARFAFPVTMLGMAAYSLAMCRPIEGMFFAVVSLAAPWLLRRQP